ncbi:MAG: MFS transporter, partial [Rhodospirillales bacterium]|nr:MFS transporter [Rhodospirillales bacterium]
MSAAAPPVPRLAEASPAQALASGFLGWLFDAMDLNLFVLVMVPALRDLTGLAAPAALARIGGVIVAGKVLGWGLGGVVFGVVADRIGRSATLVWTIAIYAVFTALSGLAGSWPWLALWQFLAGIGIGGEWAAGAALVAESFPDRGRARAMQVMQMAYPFGVFLAGGLAIMLGPFGWRFVLLAGIVPVAAAAYARLLVPEPRRGRDARAGARARAAAGGR